MVMIMLIGIQSREIMGDIVGAMLEGDSVGSRSMVGTLEHLSKRAAGIPVDLCAGDERQQIRDSQQFLLGCLRGYYDALTFMATRRIDGEL